MKSNRVWLMAGAAVVVLAVVGVVVWLVVPGKPGGTPAAAREAAITGTAVKQVLLDGAELTALLGQPFKEAAGSPKYGGFSEMNSPATPDDDCVGVVNVAAKRAYRSADVQSYTRQTWVDAESGRAGAHQPGSKVMFVDEAVIALPNAAAANALFAKFTEQWQRCDGQAVNQQPSTAHPDDPPPFPGTEMHIRDVRVTDTVLSASIVMDKNPKAPDTRAIGVQGNCLVGVLIAFTGVEHATGSADPATSSTATVRAMLDKAGELS